MGAGLSQSVSSITMEIACSPSLRLSLIYAGLHCRTLSETKKSAVVSCSFINPAIYNPAGIHATHLSLHRSTKGWHLQEGLGPHE